VVEPLLQALAMQTMVLSAAIGGVRVLRALVVRRLGAGPAYLCWLMVPAAMLAVMLPRAASDALVVRIDVSTIAAAWTNAVPSARVAAGGVLASFAAAAWGAGALSLAVLLAWRQRRFDALVIRSRGAPARLPAGAGPAVVGVFRPCIALPRDFESRFDAEERRLVLLHEGVHLRRRDNAWNLLAGALLVTHWFNPVAWWAWRRLRADQELACDAEVLRREPSKTLATYAGALLKVQGVSLASPLAAAWRSTHPLVERVRMLQLHRISPARHRAGSRVAALGIVLAGIGGYTLQAGAGALPAAASGNEDSVMTAVRITQTSVHRTAPDVSNKTSVETDIRVLSRMGEQALIRIGNTKSGLAPFEFGLTVSRRDGDRLQMDARLSGGTPPAVLGSPRLIVHDGEEGRLSIDTGEAAGAFTISLSPKVLDASQAAAAASLKPTAEAP